MARKTWFDVYSSQLDCDCSVLNKEASTMYYVQNMLNKTANMFEYTGLPDTIPAYLLEMYLQTGGNVCITEVNGSLYALPGNLGGPPDPYFRPTLYVVANPGLGYSASLTIVNHLPPYGAIEAQGKCVLIRNDTSMAGLLKTFTRYASQMTENDISIRSAQINSRQQALISASTDSELVAANEYLKGIEAGKMVAVGEQAFLEGIRVSNVSTVSSNSIIQLIELQQYLKASWYNEIGLNSAFNMKREYLSEQEIQSSTDILLPLIDDMLRCREECIAVVNSTYGTSIKVEKGSSWANKTEEVDTAKDKANAEVDKLEAEAGEEDGENAD